MKAFWFIVALLVVAGAALLIVGKPQDSGSSGQTASAPTVGQKSNSASTDANAEPVTRFEVTPTPQPEILPNVSIVPKEGAAAIQTGAPVPAAVPSASAAASVTSQAPAHSPGHSPLGPVAPAATTGSGNNTSTNAGTLADFQIAPGEIKPQPDGTILVDSRFTIKGDGSEANPYRVPWEYLISANEVFDPAKSMNKIPERIAMLEGKHVRLTGYVAFPLMVQRPRELLSMLNQWDGCCIGVPPTPYDAVEVKLKKSVSKSEQYANAGQVQGIFRTQPYVVKNWLVGMYVMNDATFIPVDTGEEPTDASGAIVN